MFLLLPIVFLNLAANRDLLFADADQSGFTAPATIAPNSPLQTSLMPRAGSTHWSQVPSKDGWTLVASGTTDLISKVEDEKIYLGKNSLDQDTYFCYSSYAKTGASFFPLVYLLVGGEKITPLCPVHGSHGYIRAANGHVANPADNYPLPQNIQYYKKTERNGLDSYWLSYDSDRIDDEEGLCLHVDIILKGRLAGGVVISYYLTNVDNVTHQPAIEYSQFSLNGWTHVVGNGSDLIKPGYLLSDHRGLYYQTASQNYRLNILMNGENHPDNWKADQIYQYFTALDETGNEVTPWDPAGDHVAKPNSEEADFKNQPIDFLPGATTSFSWEYDLIMADVPNITLDQNDQDLYNNQDYRISGYWRDFKGSSADLYYQIDGQPPVKYLTINNPVKGDDVPWEYTIPKAALQNLYGNHTITVWGVNNYGNQKSNMPKVLLNFLRPKLNVKYVLKKADGSMVDLPGTTATTQEGAFGETFSVTPRRDLDVYEFSWDETRVANSTLAGLAFNPSTNVISGTYQDIAQTLTLVYLAGKLELKAPITIDLGQKILIKSTNYLPVINQGSVAKLEVVDHRPQTDKSNWSVTAKLINATHPGTEIEMPEGMLIFKKSGIEQTLTKTNSVNILTKSTATHPVGTEITPISDTWDQNTGLFVKAERTKVQKARYVAAIEWTCVEATP